MTLIETKTVGSGGAANIEFTGLGSYSSTYTDLYIVCSLRSNQPYTADNTFIQLNGSSSNFNWKNVYSTGSGSPSPQTGTDNQIGGHPGTGTTTNAFGNQSFYIADFSSSNYKLINGDGVVGNASTRGDDFIWSTLWSNNAAITSIKLLPSAGLFIQNSTASLYGVAKVTSTPKATGGIVSQDASYWYHMFPFTSTFTPTVALTADILCIAGGGGGSGGGGGAGGLLGFTSQSLTTTGYTVTIGAGGAGIVNAVSQGNNGGDSQFGSLTLVKGGGGGAAGGGNSVNGSNGGSGGGAFTGGASNSGSIGYGGSPTSGQGYAGGNTHPQQSSKSSTGGGGGAGGAGGTPTTNDYAGAGGIGSSSYSSWGLATFTGEMINNVVYFAGGGGGGYYINGVLLPGGYGGGGSGTTGNTYAITNGKTNTGGGGGGAYSPSYNSAGNGGSGVVIVRYAK